MGACPAEASNVRSSLRGPVRPSLGRSFVPFGWKFRRILLLLKQLDSPPGGSGLSDAGVQLMVVRSTYGAIGCVEPKDRAGQGKLLRGIPSRWRGDCCDLSAMSLRLTGHHRPQCSSEAGSRRRPCPLFQRSKKSQVWFPAIALVRIVWSIPGGSP